MMYTGQVKSFNPHKGWGFVGCDGGDVFLLKKELRGYCVEAGETIRFTVEQGQKGQQATNIQVAGGEKQFYLGEIKSYNSQKGFGFIGSEATEVNYGKDVFLLRSELPGGVGPEGAHCKFQVKLSEKGQPQATNVTLLGKGAELAKQQGFGGMNQGGVVPAMAMGKGMMHPQMMMQQMNPQMMMQLMAQMQQQHQQHVGYQAIGGKGSGGKGGGTASPTGKVPGETEVFFGQMKSINTEKGWGHVESAAMSKVFGRDLFAMQTSIASAGVTAGQQVTFNVAQGPKGPHAVNLRPVPHLSPQRVFAGTLKTFNEQKGWGFAEAAHLTQLIGTDVFVHAKELNGATPTVGMGLQFTVDIATGKAQAKNVRVQEAGWGAAPAAYTGAGKGARSSPY